MTRDWDETRIAALIDGAIDDPEEAARLREALRTDPEARAVAERIERTDRLVREAFPLPDASETPRRLRSMLEAPDTGSAAAGAQVIPLRRSGRGRALAGLALAASALLAVGVGVYLGRAPLGGPAGPQTAAADAALQRTLETVPSGTAGADGIRPMLSFRDGTGRICREYERPAPDRATRAGIACRSGDGTWRIEGETRLVGPSEGGGEDYATASGAEARDLARVLDGLEAGPPLAPDTEEALLRSGWSRED